MAKAKRRGRPEVSTSYLYEGLACQEVFSRLTFLLFLRFKRVARAQFCIDGTAVPFAWPRRAVNPRSPQGRGTRGVDGDSASRAKWRTPSDASRRNAADRTPSASNWIDPRVKPENPRQPVRHEVVTHVSGTICYLCVRAGQGGSVVAGEGLEPPTPGL